MEETFYLVLTMSLVGTLMFLLLWILTPITKKLFSGTWHYYMPLVAVMFLLIPCQLGFSLVDFSQFIETDTSLEHINDLEIKATTNNQLQSNNKVGQYPVENIKRFAYKERSTHGIPRIFHYGSVFYGLLPYIWGIGMFLFIIIKLRQYFILCKIIKRTSKDVVDEKIREVFEQCKKQMKIHRTIQLRVNQHLHTPLLMGLIKPIIFIPDENIESRQLNLIFKHELIHYERLDLLYKMLVLMVNGIHWFNPFVYLLNHQVNQLCEQSCDEVLIGEMSSIQRKQYGETILSLLDKAQYKPLVLPTALCQTQKGIKRRLIHIMNFKKSKIRMITLSIFASFILIGIGMIIGSTVTMNSIAKEKGFFSDQKTDGTKNDTQLASAEKAISNLMLQEELLEQPRFAGKSFYGASNLYERADLYLSYRKEKNDFAPDDLDIKIAEFILRDRKDKDYSTESYYIYSTLLGVTKENRSIQHKKIQEVCDILFFPGTTIYEVNDISVVEALNYAKKDIVKINEDGIQVKMDTLYLDSTGKIEKITWNQEFLEKVDNGINPLL